MTSAESLRLRRVLASLASRLDEQTGGLSAAEELAESRRALARLADTDRAADVLAELDDLPRAEVAWLAEEVLRRWARIGTAVVDPVVRVVAAPRARAPYEAGAGPANVGGPPGHTPAGPPVRLRVEVDGLEPGWTVAWTGATAQPDADDGPPADADGAGDPPGDPDGAGEPDAPPTAKRPSAVWDGAAAVVTARVLGRGPDGRVVLTASWRPDRAAEEAGA